MKKSALLGIAAAVFSGAVLRLLWPRDIEFNCDEEWTCQQVQQCLAGGPVPQLGMPASVGVPNCGMSVWIFIPLGAVFRVENPVELARAVEWVHQS